MKELTVSSTKRYTFKDNFEPHVVLTLSKRIDGRTYRLKMRKYDKSLTLTPQMLNKAWEQVNENVKLIRVADEISWDLYHFNISVSGDLEHVFIEENGQVILHVTFIEFGDIVDLVNQMKSEMDEAYGGTDEEN